MIKSGPIVVVEDDLDDQELLAEAFKALNYPRQIKFFTDGYEALKFIELSERTPFLILSDVNMPRINGFELRNEVRKSAKLNLRIIPFLFFTTGAQKEAVEAAFSDSAQGFFIKPGSMRQLQSIISKIVDYWEECYLPAGSSNEANSKATAHGAAVKDAYLSS